MYSKLNYERVLETADELQTRIFERFPDSSLAKVADELLRLAQNTTPRIAAIRKPNILLRSTVVILVVAIVAVVVQFVVSHRLFEKELDATTTKSFVELVEPSLGSMFFIGTFIFFFWTLETRMKRNRALSATHELRVIAHIIDMHQLTKDPEILLFPGPKTKHSPDRTMSPFELTRYLDYCSEMLSVTSKVAALYAQSFTDPIALSAVDQVEVLTAGLSRKIWQKLMILERFEPGENGGATKPNDQSN